MRIKSIDVAKGILILLVITGHVVLGGATTLVHYIIYSFHMPVFIGLSGYILNWEGLRRLSSAALARKYWHRMIIPWILAVIIYGLVTGTWTIRAYFHLWFIPAYLSWILISRLLMLAGLTIRQIFFAGLCISVACGLIRFLPQSMPAVIDGLLSTFRPDYYVFFALGGLLKEYKKGVSVRTMLPLSLLLMASVVMLYYYPDVWLSFWLSFVLNGCLICLMLSWVAGGRSFSQPFLEWVGFNSLGIYLWHVLPVLFAFRFIGKGPALFYLLAIGLELVFFGLVYFTAKVPFFRRYFYGLPVDTVSGHRGSIT